MPVAIRDAILRGLSGDRTARFPTLRDLLDALALDPRAPEPPQPRRRRWPLAVAALVIAGGGAVAVAVAQRDHGSAPAVIRDAGAIGSQPLRPWATDVGSGNEHRALELFQAANKLLNDGDFANAAKDYAAALRLYDHPAIHFNYALALMTLNRPREVLAHIDASLIYPDALDPDKVTQAHEIHRAYTKIVSDLGSGSASLTSGQGLLRLQVTFDDARSSFNGGESAKAATQFAAAYVLLPFSVFLYDEASATSSLAATRATSAVSQGHRDLPPLSPRGPWCRGWRRGDPHTRSPRHCGHCA